MSVPECTYTIHEINRAAEFVLANRRHNLICFYGDMGAGKTTLIQAICKNLQTTTEVSSPTFSLVNEYLTTTGAIVYHFDFYRIRSLEEVYDIGYEQYFDSGNLCLIEWPEQIEPLLEQESVDRFHIQAIDSGTRCIRFDE